MANNKEMVKNYTKHIVNDTDIVNEISAFDPTAIKFVQLILCIVTSLFSSYGLFLLVNVKRQHGPRNNIVSYI